MQSQKRSLNHEVGETCQDGIFKWPGSQHRKPVICTLWHRYPIVLLSYPGFLEAVSQPSVERWLKHLDYPCFDRDEILETFFKDQKCLNEETRHQLSRAADWEIQVKALRCTRAVLDSFWRYPCADSRSGTPSAWLTASDVHAVEVLCKCLPYLAAERFLNRTRHDEHLDCNWNRVWLIAQSQELTRSLPLGVGALIEIDTTATVDFAQLAVQVRIGLNVDSSFK